MIKKYAFIGLVLFGLCGWGKASPVNIFDEPQDLPDRKIFHREEQGKAAKLSEFDGNFVIAIFWSRYCTPCIQELEKISAFQKKVKDTNIKVVMISPASEWISDVEQQNFLDRFHAGDLDFYVDRKGDLSADLGIFTSPNTVLVNTKGQEIGRIRGAVEWDKDAMVEYIYNIKAKQE